MQHSVIKDSFSSDFLLPKQPGIWWIKYKKDILYDKIVINFNDEFEKIELNELINTLKLVKVFDHEKDNKLKFIECLPNDLISPGFIGFDFLYDGIPSKETTIHFTVSFICASKTIDKVNFDILIIRPILKLPNPSLDEIDITSDRQNFSDLSLLYIFNEGHGFARKIILRVKSRDDNIHTELRTVERIKERYNFIKQTSVQEDLSVIFTGRGKGVVEFIAEYLDDNNNSYSSILGHFTVNLGDGKIITKEIRINPSYSVSPVINN